MVIEFRLNQTNETDIDSVANIHLPADRGK